MSLHRQFSRRISRPVSRGLKIATVITLMPLLATACATREGGEGGRAVDSAVADQLQEEGAVEVLDHQFPSATIQAQLVAQVFNELGGDAEVLPMADLNAAFPAIANQTNLFDPEQWRLLTEASFQKYVADEKSVISFADAELSGEEGWYVPTYVIEGDEERGIEPMCPGLPDWEALNNCADVFSTTRTGEKGQLLSVSKAYDEFYGNAPRIENLDLDYEIAFAGSNAALDAEWKRAIDAGEPLLGMMWKPSYTGLKYDLTRVELPPYTPECWETDFACNWGPVDVQSIANPDFEKEYPTYARILKNYTINDEQLLDMMTAMQEGVDAEEAVATWMQENREVWQRWAA